MSSLLFQIIFICLDILQNVCTKTKWAVWWPACLWLIILGSLWFWSCRIDHIGQLLIRLVTVQSWMVHVRSWSNIWCRIFQVAAWQVRDRSHWCMKGSCQVTLVHDMFVTGRTGAGIFSGAGWNILKWKGYFFAPRLQSADTALLIFTPRKLVLYLVNQILMQFYVLPSCINAILADKQLDTPFPRMQMQLEPIMRLVVKVRWMEISRK